MSYIYSVTNEFINGNGILYPVTHRFVKKDGALYPITHKFVKSSLEPTQAADFAFVIYGDQYTVDYLSGEALNFTIDWGDGTETVVNSTTVEQRRHAYATMQEWTITIKNYTSGWIQFEHSSNTAQRAKLRRVLTPFPASDTRTLFRYCFSDCASLTAIPERLFAGNPNVESFMYCFNNCTSLTTIPERLFVGNPNVESFQGCFNNCTSLTTIPERLFEGSPNVVSFNSCFYNCTSLTTIPERLFEGNPNVENFQNCFFYCVSLITIPEKLFGGNPNVTSFANCFRECRNLLNINLIFHENVLAHDVNYASMFNVSLTAYSHTGLAPELWSSATTTPNYKTQCFRNNRTLINYADIPTEWR